jgi:transketolase
MKEKDMDRLAKLAQDSRRDVIEMIFTAGSGHSGGSLSCAELMTVIYEKYMNISAENPQWENRDRFILSKGHAAPMLYATLAKQGFFDRALLKTLRELDSPLQGHPCMFKLSGVDMSTGSLGLGLSVAVGMALSAKLLNKSNDIYVLCGDGELQEGQNWEALRAIKKWNLTNIICVIDRNNVQLDGTNEEIMPMGNLKKQIEALDLNVEACDGHDIGSIIHAIDHALKFNTPTVIIANTIKGKGVSFMEGKSEWHGKPLDEKHYQLAIKEIEEGITS